MNKINWIALIKAIGLFCLFVVGAILIVFLASQFPVLFIILLLISVIIWLYLAFDKEDIENKPNPINYWYQKFIKMDNRNKELLKDAREFKRAYIDTNILGKDTEVARDFFRMFPELKDEHDG
jgi:hypothetical protein